MEAAYIRVSSEESAEKGYSIENQIDEVLKKLGKKRNEVKLYIDPGYSGEFLERPALTKLRQDVKSGLITKIGCYDPDRLSRKLMNALIIDDEFRSKGVEIVYTNGEYADSPEGKLFYSLRGAISEFEKAKINQRMTGGRKRKAKEGKVVKNSKMYGYNYNKEKGKYEINEEEAKIVKMIFDLFTKPNDIVEGINGIAKYLTSNGVPTKRGAKVWHRQVVRQIILNESYTGRYVQFKYNTEGMLKNKIVTNPEDKVKMTVRDEDEWILSTIPAIISEEQFDHAGQMISESRRRYAKGSKHKYLLSGLVRCGKCGNTMTGRIGTNWGTKIPFYEDRKNYAGAKHKGCGNKIKCAELDEAVWNQLKTFFDNPDKINEFDESTLNNEDYEQIELERLEKELEKTKKGIKRLYAAFATNEDMGEDELKESIKEFEDKRDLLSKQHDELYERINKRTTKQTNETALREAVEFYLKKDKLSLEDKQELIRTAVKEIRFYDDENIEIMLF